MAMENGTEEPVAAVSNSKEALEQQYMQLLEQRIAQLKVEVANAGAKETITPESKSKTKSEETTEESSKDATDAKAASSKTEDKETKDKDGEESKTEENDSKDEATVGGPEEEKAKATATARVRHIIAKYNEDKMSYEDMESSKAAESDDEDKKRDLTTTFRRYMDLDKPRKVDFEQVDIYSPELKRLVREVARTKTPELNFDPDDTTTMIFTSPFKDFVWFWTEFERACDPLSDDSEDRKTAREDLKALMAIIRKSQLEPYFKVKETLLKDGTLPFDYLWTLFPPGTQVVAKSCLDDHQIFEVRTCSSPSLGRVKYDEKDFVVTCLGFDWDGTKFDTFEYDWLMTRKNDKDDFAIDSLDVYPLAYHRSGGERADEKLKKELAKRGRHFWSLCSASIENFKFQYDYSGAIVTRKRSRSGMAYNMSSRLGDDDSVSSLSGGRDAGGTVGNKLEFHGPIIVDAYSFLRSQEHNFDSNPQLGDLVVETFFDSDCLCHACKQSPLISWSRSFRHGKALQEQYEAFADNEGRLMMCPPRVLGYAIKTKEWAQFKVRQCKQASEENATRKEYFKDQLQLDDDYKKMLLAFVNNHQSSTTNGNDKGTIGKSLSLDVIEGKGKGLAILLHGPPGVGKTLTAETIALATARPLLTVSVAEIGTDAALAEDRLNVFFTIAARWGAILLVDEADVFLEERVKTDNPSRNMLVSVLLRSLEYYEGIIFLTTNRIRSIDIAVQSRMHLAIQYKNLKKEQQAAIYRNLLDKIDPSMIKGKKDKLYRDIENVLCRRSAMNGRQIRNIVSSALSLAASRADGDDSGEGGDGRLQFEDLRRVHETTTDFLESLKDTTEKAMVRNQASED